RRNRIRTQCAHYEGARREHWGRVVQHVAPTRLLNNRRARGAARWPWRAEVRSPEETASEGLLPALRAATTSNITSPVQASAERSSQQTSIRQTDRRGSASVDSVVHVYG